MVSLVQIRNVPDQTRRRLKARAAANGESLNSYLLKVLEQEASRPTMDEVLDRAAQRSERSRVSALGALDDARAERESSTSKVPVT